MCKTVSKDQSILLHQYLDSENGREYRKMLRDEVGKLGNLPARKCGLRYAILAELLFCIDWIADGNHDSMFNIPLSATISDSRPDDVLRCNLNWAGVDYSPMILPTVFDDKAAVAQMSYAFDDWTHRNGEPLF